MSLLIIIPASPLLTYQSEAIAGKQLFLMEEAAQKVDKIFSIASSVGIFNSEIDP